jgi:ATP-dependent Zn protease
MVATAYHEAGHATVGFQLRRNMPRGISIRPQGSSLGRTQNCSFPRWFRPELRLPARTRQALETETATIFAGFEAEKRYTGKPNYFGAGPDFEGAKVYARLVASDDEGVTAYIGWCLYRARQAVMDNWPAIDRFARDLLERGELFGRELHVKLTAACRLANSRVRRENHAKSPLRVGKL